MLKLNVPRIIAGVSFYPELKAVVASEAAKGAVLYPLSNTDGQSTIGLNLSINGQNLDIGRLT